MEISRRRFLAGAAALLAAFAGGRRPKYVILVDWEGFDPDLPGPRGR